MVSFPPSLPQPSSPVSWSPPCAAPPAPPALRPPITTTTPHGHPGRHHRSSAAAAPPRKPGLGPRPARHPLLSSPRHRAHAARYGLRAASGPQRSPRSRRGALWQGRAPRGAADQRAHVASATWSLWVRAALIRCPRRAAQRAALLTLRAPQCAAGASLVTLLFASFSSLTLSCLINRLVWIIAAK